jgi:hypothetical protein
LQLDDGNCGEKERDADDVAVKQIQSVRIMVWMLGVGEGTLCTWRKKQMCQRIEKPEGKKGAQI